MIYGPPSVVKDMGLATLSDWQCLKTDSNGEKAAEPSNNARERRFSENTPQRAVRSRGAACLVPCRCVYSSPQSWMR